MLPAVYVERTLPKVKVLEMYTDFVGQIPTHFSSARDHKMPGDLVVARRRPR